MGATLQHGSIPTHPSKTPHHWGIGWPGVNLSHSKIMLITILKVSSLQPAQLRRQWIDGLSVWDVILLTRAWNPLTVRLEKVNWVDPCADLPE